MLRLSSGNDNVVLQVNLHFSSTKKKKKIFTDTYTCSLGGMSNGTSEKQDLILSFPLSKFVFQKPNRKFEALQYFASMN